MASSGSAVRDVVSQAPYVPRVAREWVVSSSADDRHQRIPGSVVFVDISGFTAMSERLSRLGKVGAEHVTELIDRCFGRLLAEAYDYGATLLKFGGDALLLFFSGAAHERRAAAAALEMRRALREVGRFSTDAGRVTLRMTAGVHSGEFDFFLVGDSHRELLIAGPTATAAAAVEGAARTGQIVVSHATAAMLPPANLGADVGAGRLLRGTMTGVVRGGVETYDTDVDLGSLIPVGLRAELSTIGQSEHRRVTIAFVHFEGIDDIVSRSGPEHAATLLHELVGMVQAAIDPRRVCFLSTDLAPDGGKIILTAGAPVGHGDDEEQMLLALNELIERHPTIPIRIGVNTGDVFAGEIGTVHRRNYTVMGDAVNLAARVMAKAAPGQVLATRSTLAPPRTLFETTALEPFQVKGKRRPVTAYAVGRARGVRTDVAASDVPIVGRDTQLGRVLQRVSALADASGGLVEFVGPPGSGKSRFLAELERRVAPLTIRRVQCRLYQAATPYFAFPELLAELVGISEVLGSGAPAVDRLTDVVSERVPHLIPWLPLIAVPFGLEIADTAETSAINDQFRKARLEDSIVELLVASVTQSTIVCFEDVHWMDDASSDLLRAIARAAAHQPWLLCVTRRETATGFEADVVEEHDERIDLEPLGAEASAALVDALTRSQPLPRHIVRSLVERADGNPLFLLELVNALLDGGDLESLPGTVEGLLTARLDRLHPGDRSLLRHLSVLGAGFRAQHASAVEPSGQSLTPESLRRLGEFLAVDGDWVKFRHALARDVAYAGLPYGTRRRLHGQIADSIVDGADQASDAQAALLSVHFLRAQRYAEAWHYAVAAGDAAREVSANIEAATLYERALWAGRHLSELTAAEVTAVLEALGDVADLAGLYEQSRRAYSDARARFVAVSDRASTARVLLKEAFVAERRSRYTEAVRAIRRAERTLEGMSGPEVERLRAQLSVWLGAIRAGQGRWSDADRAARLGTDLALESGDDQALARGLLVLDYAEAALGRPRTSGGATRALEIYLTLGDLAGEAVAANSLGVTAYFDGRWTEAIAWYAQARAARVRTGDPVNTAFADANVAEILVDQGRLAEAEELLISAGAAWTAAGDEWGRAFVQRMLGMVAARAGRSDDAFQLLDSSRTAFVGMGAVSDVVATDITIAEVLVLNGRGDEALQVLAGVSAAGALDQLAPAWHRIQGIALAQSARPDGFETGRHELEMALAVARDHQSLHQIALALDALDQLDQSLGTDSSGLRYEATDIFRRLDVVAPLVYPLTTRDGTRDLAVNGT